MMNTNDYIISLQKEIQRLNKLVIFYEEIILSNEELKEMYRDKLRNYAGSKDRRGKNQEMKTQEMKKEEKKWQKR